MTLADRIEYWKLIEPYSGCWLWLGCQSTNGYGSVWSPEEKKRRPAHVASFELKHGKVPIGFELDHLCMTKSCVNPAHLEIVTHRENVIRAHDKKQHWHKWLLRRTHCWKGHPLDQYEHRRMERTIRGHLTPRRRCLLCIKINQAKDNIRKRKARQDAKKAYDRIESEAVGLSPELEVNHVQ